MVKLKNGLILSVNQKAGGTCIEGFESWNHLTNKIDPGSYTEFKDLPDIFYKEMGSDDRATLRTVTNESLETILDRTIQ